MEEKTSFERCAQCGRKLPFGGLYVHNHLGEPLCSDCATTDEEGEICPCCGRKVPRSWIVSSGICKHCFDTTDYD